MPLVEYTIIPPLDYSIGASEQNLLISLGLAVAEAQAQGRGKVLEAGVQHVYPSTNGIEATAEANEQGGGKGSMTVMIDGMAKRRDSYEFPPEKFILAGDFASKARTNINVSTIIAYEPETVVETKEQQEDITKILI